MHKNIQFQVTVKSDFLSLVLDAVEQSGLERWEYLGLVIDDILGSGAQEWACPTSPVNRKGIIIDYWTAYDRVAFILTTRGLAALAKRRDAEGYPTMASFLRSYLTRRVCDDLGVNPERIEHPVRVAKGMGFRRSA